MNLYERFLSDVDVELCKSFDCGENDISTMSSFLYEEAPIHQAEGTAFTKVFFDADNQDAIVGYYSLKASCLSCQRAGAGCSPETVIDVIPAVEIARFAVSLAYQGMVDSASGTKASATLMEYALGDIMDLREYVLGVKAVVLFSIDREKQLRFYRRFGFQRIEEENEQVFLSTENEGCVPMYLILPKVQQIS